MNWDQGKGDYIGIFVILHSCKDVPLYGYLIFEESFIVKIKAEIIVDLNIQWQFVAFDNEIIINSCEQHLEGREHNNTQGGETLNPPTC